MIRRIDFNDAFAIKGIGRIDDTRPIDLQEYVFCPNESIRKTSMPVIPIPKMIKASKNIGNTVYDVTASFDLEGKETILQQFKDFILSTNL